MRPGSIVNFERLYLLTLLIGAINVVIQWPVLVATTPVPTLLAIQAATFGITLLLVMLVSRRRNKLARLLLVAAFLIGLSQVTALFQAAQLDLASVIIAVQLLLQVAALALLFAPASRAWFDEPPIGTPD